jgi:TonB family protein
MGRDWKSWEGQVANKFPLRQFLGGTDTSAVFLTERSGPTSQPAAIKLVPADPEHPDARLSWWELTSRLSHANLLQVYETGSGRIEDSEMCYIVTEYAEEDLGRILPERALTAEEVKDALRSIVEALRYVHGKGYVHGHLKPSNVLALGDRVKLSSDGLCGVGEPGKLLGVPNEYTAPDIATGGVVSTAADVWALGVLIVEMLTQKRTAIATQSGGNVPTLPDPFGDVVEHCLKADPGSRWTIAQIGARLNQDPVAPTAHQATKVAGAPLRARYWAPAFAVAVAAILISLVLRSHRAEQGAASPTTQQAGATNAVGSPTTTTSASPSSHAPGHAGGFVAGTVSHRKMPEVTTSASHTIQGKVKVKVRTAVDASGEVTNARIDSAGPSKYFASRSLEAARQWKFTPPKMNGEQVASDWLITFEYTRKGIDDYVEEVNPSSSGRKR